MNGEYDNDDDDDETTDKTSPKLNSTRPNLWPLAFSCCTHVLDQLKMIMMIMTMMMMLLAIMIMIIDHDNSDHNGNDDRHSPAVSMCWTN